MKNSKIRECAALRLYKMCNLAEFEVSSSILQKVISIFVFFQKTQLKFTFAIQTVKAIGGGSRSEIGNFLVSMYFLANFLHFQTLFTEFKKFSPLAVKKPICSGR